MTKLDELNAVLDRYRQAPKDDAPAAATAGAPGTQTKTDAKDDSPKPAAYTPALLSPRLDGIPAELRKLKRWAPWRAEWDPKARGGQGKWQKKPLFSVNEPDRWLSFDAAAKAYEAHPKKFAGIGLVMTGIEGLVGIDLDGCVSDEGAVAPWAEEVVAQAGSYTELSPSGHGLRIFLPGDAGRDWNNHERGIEVYSGQSGRFLTVTGEALPGRTQVRPARAGWLSELEQRYAKRPTEKPAAVDIPELLDEMALPDLSALGLNYKTANFLAEGVPAGQRSDALRAASMDLASAGLDAAQVLSVFAHNPHAMGAAMDKRGQDYDKALHFLWKNYALTAVADATPKVATADDFGDVSEPAAHQGPEAARPAARFNIVHASEFGKGRKPLSWLIKKILPHATVGVLYGPSGAGKSFLVMDMAVAIARGLPEWRGNRCKQADVLYICAEGAEGAEERLQAHAEFHGYDRAAVPLWMLDDAPNLLLVKDTNDLADSIKARCSAGTRLVIVDTLAQVTPGANENASEQMGLALTHCKQIARKTGAMVLLVAHSGKDQSKGIRGWSGIKGALDVEIEVGREDDDRHYRVSKMRNGAETEWTPFGLHTVQMGVDEDGDPIASAVVLDAATNTSAARRRKGLGKWQLEVLRAAENMTSLAGPVSASHLIEEVLANTVPPEPPKRDRRRRDAMDAIASLRGAGLLVDAPGDLLGVAE